MSQKYILINFPLEHLKKYYIPRDLVIKNQKKSSLETSALLFEEGQRVLTIIDNNDNLNFQEAIIYDYKKKEINSFLKHIFIVEMVILTSIEKSELDMVLKMFSSMNIVDKTGHDYENYCIAYYIKEKIIAIEPPEFGWGYGIMHHLDLDYFKYDYSQGEIEEFIAKIKEYQNR